ncbi:MAG TPA: hypothetical protein VES19_05740 [Candidatus Limnocylindrales bacterium]|nr:hypothetical protein [Candidatus Limnocylindrales bacterium]
MEACLVLVVAACSTVTGILQGGQVASPLDGSPIPLNPSEGKVIASGRAVDDAGAPMVDVMVFVLLEPSSEVMASVKVGDRVPQVALAGVTSGTDGRFTIRLSPTDLVRATARDNNGFINLSLMAVEHWPSQGNDRIGMGGFPLSVTAAGFEELPAELTVVLAR